MNSQLYGRWPTGHRQSRKPSRGVALDFIVRTWPGLSGWDVAVTGRLHMAQFADDLALGAA
ncbi:hypothetical protein [Streptomyces botrytidirepellens]|nr:hypothetical protein [Streptomyces botrytidirepellens]